ncbi:MAG TPA: hypothetical protein VNW68_05990 [Candidatus Limnocylindria bacterium]|nr:hypothetical protein [Candidatus Limnocylindria bacterium]
MPETTPDMVPAPPVPDETLPGADHVDLRNESSRDISAESVSITEGGARDIRASTVTIRQGGAGRISGEQLTVNQGGVGIARVDSLRLEEGGSSLAVIADEANLADGANVMLLIARSASGNVRPLIDWRAAAAFAVGLVAARSLLGRRRR